MKNRRRALALSLVLLPVSGLLAGACSSATPAAIATVQDASTQDAGSHETPPGADAGASASLDAASEGSTSEGGTLDDGGGPEAAPAPTCGPPPARYTVLAGADAGLVRDNVTELVWMANSAGGGEPPQTQSDAANYCSGRGMRLPTKDEATALAAAYATCAFGQWSTWTSTAAGAGDAWVIDYAGDASPQLADNFPSAVLCVRDPTGG
jgi:hypothetical protein